VRAQREARAKPQVSLENFLRRFLSLMKTIMTDIATTAETSPTSVNSQSNSVDIAFRSATTVGARC
jgi:hypothetical protein